MKWRLWCMKLFYRLETGDYRLETIDFGICTLNFEF